MRREISVRPTNHERREDSTLRKQGKSRSLVLVDFDLPSTVGRRGILAMSQNERVWWGHLIDEEVIHRELLATEGGPEETFRDTSRGDFKKKGKATRPLASGRSNGRSKRKWQNSKAIKRPPLLGKNTYENEMCQTFWTKESSWSPCSFLTIRTDLY